MGFTKLTLNTIEWDGSANLVLDNFGPEFEAVTVTGNPNTAAGGPYRLLLNSTQATSKADVVESGFTLIVNDPNSFFTSTGLRIQPSAADTSPTPTVNGASAVQLTTETGKIYCEFVGDTNFLSFTPASPFSDWVAYDPIKLTTGGPQGVQGGQGIQGIQGGQGTTGSQGGQGI